MHDRARLGLTAALTCPPDAVRFSALLGSSLAGYRISTDVYIEDGFVTLRIGPRRTFFVRLAGCWVSVHAMSLELTCRLLSGWLELL